VRPVEARPRLGRGLALGLLASLVLLAFHARIYAFLTDDAFISFRYARNLSHGFGLVFNPGLERVEGYSNFLWVLLVAGFEMLGLRPEVSSLALSALATIGLWGSVAWFALRTPAGHGRVWIALVPTFLLALTRSVAVWSTSGLETRWFEALVVGGVLRLVVELEAHLAGSPRRWPLASFLLGLATLTRPDGALLAAAALATAGLVLVRARKLEPRAVAALLGPVAILFVAQLAFRLVYYHQWLPNTYYAKTSGHTWWSMGFSYLATFVLEYAVWLWIPFLVASFFFHRRHGTMHVPLVFAAVIVPHALYVAAIGGDHFEYRPLDLYFPLVFLLIADGARELATTRARAVAVATGLAVLVIGLVELPWQSHVQFPGRYESGFPGLPVTRPGTTDDWSADTYLVPTNDPIYHQTPLNTLAALYRDLVVATTAHYVGIRQEEHDMFLHSVTALGARLHAAVAEGRLPRDTYIAVDAVGAIPYYSDLRTLDRLGLTDGFVSHMPLGQRTMLAHEKHATLGYAHARGVDFWALDAVHVAYPATEPRLLQRIRYAVHNRDSVYAADIGGSYFVLAALPEGSAATRARFPRLDFRIVSDSTLVPSILAAAVASFQDSLRRHPDDPDTYFRYGHTLYIGHDYARAAAVLDDAVRALPKRPDLWVLLGAARVGLGDQRGAYAAMSRALGAAQMSGNWAMAEAIEQALERGRRRGLVKDKG